MAKQQRCPECEKRLMQKKKVTYELYGVTIGKYPALVCKCGATYFNSKTVKKIDAAVKKKGLWGLDAKTKILVSGNSYAVRIPKPIFNFLGLKKGEEVNITTENKHKIIITV